MITINAQSYISTTMLYGRIYGSVLTVSSIDDDTYIFFGGSNYGYLSFHMIF